MTVILRSEITRLDGDTETTSPGVEQRLTIVTPAPPVTPTPSPVPTSTPTPSPTPSPTPTPAPVASVARVLDPQTGALSCSEPQGDSVKPGQTLELRCTYSIRYSFIIGYRTTISVSASPGWDVGLSASFGSAGSYASGMNGDGSAAVEIPHQTSLNGTITVVAKAPTSATPGSTGRVTLTVITPNCVITCNPETRGSATFEASIVSAACAEIPGASITASISGVSLPAIPYSTSQRTNSGTATLLVQNPRQCSGWVVDISATDFVHSGAAPGGVAIPAGNMRISGTGVQTVQLSNQARRLISNGSTQPTASYPLTIQLTIPAGTLAGTYTSTVTIHTSAAP